MSDNLPLSFTIERTKSVPPVSLARVTDGIIKSSFGMNDLPLWLLITTVYTCSFVRLYLPDAVATNSTLFLSKTDNIGPEADEDAPVTFSPLSIDRLPLAAHFKNVFGVSVFSLPGTIFFAGFSASTFEMYVLTGIVELFLLK